jgi:hypothetical protein
MANTVIDVQISFTGKTPIVTGDKRLTLINLARLLRNMNHGGQGGGSSQYVDVQASEVAASATVTVAAPTTGQTVTIAGTALTAQQSRARAVIDPDTVQAADFFTLNGVVFTAVNGAVVLGEATFDCSGSDTACATSIAAQVSAYAHPDLTGLIGAFVTSTDEVTFYAFAEGTSGNAFTLTSSSNSTLPVTGSGFLAGGAAVANNKFDFGTPDAYVAASLARAVNASTTAAVQQVTASVSSAVVTLTAKVSGVSGNAITLTSASGTTLAVTGSGFLAGGSAGAVTRFNF